ncbi:MULTISPECIES: CatB-related O-acetyltransferase [Psychrobacter]|uniref:Capsular polysaccharide biosynthesis protein Cap5H n=1 Tax=Psychrobacter alimentarius TaxID=261164 RepID=A0ABM5ZW57_9GAMM|nr:MULTISPECIES: CatB-related O-acetyltransferase [Psychrobacter]AMT96345.1 Capsular polysaccharide biosynthesis protein Cap5H [Psychrobacter alimentarius]QCB31258.1 CatB-related O-acetyltransferase [Psychrobacter sp. PAMC27889]
MKNLIFLLINKFLKKIRLHSIRNSSIGKYVKINAGTQIIGSKVDDFSYCGYDCNIINTSIGKFCCLADRVTIGGASHPMHFVSMSSVFLSHKDSSVKKLGKLQYLPSIYTSIGHDVWIGNSVIIKSGVKIGTGSVIGAGSVVTKDVEPYAVVAGNPARIIRSRFDEELKIDLLRSEWWNYSEEKLLTVSHLFDEPVEFIKEINK